MSDSDDRRGLTVTIRSRRYFVSERVLFLLLIGVVAVAAMEVVFRTFLQPTTAIMAVAHAATITYGFWLGLKVEIDDADEDDGHGEVDDVDQEAVTQ